MHSLATLDAVSASFGQEHALGMIPFDSVFAFERNVESLGTFWDDTGAIGLLREVIWSAVGRFLRVVKPIGVKTYWLLGLGTWDLLAWCLTIGNVGLRRLPIRCR